MHVAILSARCGHVHRGAERMSNEFYKGLSHETKVFSLYASDWTVQVPGIPRTDSRYKYYLYPVNALDKIRNIHRICRGIVNLPLKLIPYNSCFLDKWDLEIITFALNINKSLAQFKPDVVINQTGSLVGLAMRKFRRIHHVPFIQICGAGNNIIEIKNAQTQPDAYVAQTPSGLEFIKKRFPGLNIKLIPNGFDHKLYTQETGKISIERLQELSKSKDVQLEHPIILSTSALDKVKRLDTLIHAISLLPSGTLIFTSDGDERENLISLGKKLLGKRFVYLGVVPEKELPKIYKTADVFCITSIGEPFGNVIVEALGANTPVVADDDLDRRWMIGEGGILTDVRDVRKLAAAIQAASEKDWGTKPRDQALSRFTWEKVMRQYDELIQEVYLNFHAM